MSRTVKDLVAGPGLTFEDVGEHELLKGVPDRGGCTASPADSCHAHLDTLTLGRYLPILRSVRRRTGVLIPLEAAILSAGLELRNAGEPDFHGFQLAKELRDQDDARRLTAHGTLYKALDRMERAGLLESRWEDPEVAVEQGRPRRRLYRVTGNGERASVRAAQDRAAASAGLIDRGLA